MVPQIGSVFLKSNLAGSQKKKKKNLEMYPNEMTYFFRW